MKCLVEVRNVLLSFNFVSKYLLVVVLRWKVPWSWRLGSDRFLLGSTALICSGNWEWRSL